VADIGQSATGETVRFIAASPRGDDWMRMRCKSIDISFDLPSEAATAKAFRDAALAARLVIADL